jgi:nitronate monooxygenase
MELPMSVPLDMTRGLKLPVIAAPMFLVSGPELVIAACRSGVIGTFPALGQRTTAGYAEWLDEIEAVLGPGDACHGVNLVVDESNARLQADLEVTVRHKVPLVITSLGVDPQVIAAIHGYGGLVFHDVVNVKHARKASGAGVDGLILVCTGAGGHAGAFSPFPLMHEVRQIFDGAIILAGGVSTGRDIAAAMMLGADFVSMGTRFINTAESRAPTIYKEMIVGSQAVDVTYTAAISGVPANFLNASLLANGVDPKGLATKSKAALAEELGFQVRAWDKVWSAGQGVGAINDVPSIADLVARLRADFDRAKADFLDRFRDPPPIPRPTRRRDG